VGGSDFIEAIEEEGEGVGGDEFLGELAGELVLLGQFGGEPVGQRGLILGPGGEVEDKGQGGVGVSLGPGKQGLGKLEEEHGFASAGSAKDEEFAAGFLEEGEDVFVGRDGGFLFWGLQGAAAEGLGQVFEAELEPDAFVEGVFEDPFDPGGADVVEDGLMVAEVLGGGQGRQGGHMGSELLSGGAGEMGAGLSEVSEEVGEAVMVVEVDEEGADFFGEGCTSEFVPVEVEVEGKGLQFGQGEVVGDLLAEFLERVVHTD
jgi:hypothetical protein